MCLLLALTGITAASTFHGDSARTGNFSDYGPKTGQLVYRVALNPVHGSPVVANGTI